ncbi:hypothetical protein [Carnobacterium maltaromaticum]|uniref:hypothetical protein n=1 Tax=Carnobacterium maltaromaticum TaxID=2751 RepID=UPI00295F392F|nr:hypothetical protein [Carnobacterium maltaromaticum]
MKKKIVVLLAVFSLLLVIVGCGKSEAVKEKKKASDDVFANGATFYTRRGEDWSEDFKVTLNEKNELKVVTLKNSQETLVPYETEKQEDGNVVYRFNGSQSDGDIIFGQDESDKFIFKIDNAYYFISPSTIENENIDLKDFETIKKRSVKMMREKE